MIRAMEFPVDNLRIGIDLDGVLGNFTKAFAAVANRLFPDRNIPEDDAPVTSWNWVVESGLLTKQEQSAVWEEIKHTENFWLKETPYVDNVEAMSRFLSENRRAHVYYITSRIPTVVGPSLLTQTNNWLAAHHLRRSNTSVFPVVHSDPIGGVPPKLAIAEALGVIAHIDDYLPTVCSLGQLGFLLDRPWNRQFRPPSVRVVHSLQEFLDKFKDV